NAIGGRPFEYRVPAYDADGDPLTFSVVGTPPCSARLWPSADHTSSPLFGPFLSRRGNCNSWARNALTIALAEPVRRYVWKKNAKVCWTRLSGSRMTRCCAL